MLKFNAPLVCISQKFCLQICCHNKKCPIEIICRGLLPTLSAFSISNNSVASAGISLALLL